MDEIYGVLYTDDRGPRVLQRGVFAPSRQLCDRAARKLFLGQASRPADWELIVRLFLWQLIADRVAPVAKRDADAHALCEMVAFTERTDAPNDPDAEETRDYLSQIRHKGSGVASNVRLRNLRRKWAARNPKGVSISHPNEAQQAEDRAVCQYFWDLIKATFADACQWKAVLFNCAEAVRSGNVEPQAGAVVPDGQPRPEFLLAYHDQGPGSAASSADGADSAASGTPAADSPTDASPMAEPSPRRRPPRLLATRRARVIALAAAIVIVAGAAVGAWALWPRPTPLSEQVALEYVDDGFWPDTGASYWVPASADFTSLPATMFYCDDSTIAWLKDQGASRQYLPQRVTIKNTSGQPGLIDVSRVTATGSTSQPATPGLVFYCPSGGNGELEWFRLHLRLEDGSMGQPDQSDSPFFQYSLDQDGSVGLQLTLDGELDFAGTISARLARTGMAPQLTALPMSPDGTTAVRWHGIPAEKYLSVTPTQQAEATGFDCQSSKEQLRGEPCTAAQIRQRLTELWGQ